MSDDPYPATPDGRYFVFRGDVHGAGWLRGVKVLTDRRASDPLIAVTDRA